MGKQQGMKTSPELARLRTVVELSTIGIWEWNVRTDALHWSPDQMSLVGLPEEEFRPHVSTFKDRLHPDDAERIWAALRAHLEQGEPYDVMMRLRHDDGHYIELRGKGVAERDESGSPVRMTGVTYDISDLRDTRRRRWQWDVFRL